MIDHLKKNQQNNNRKEINDHLQNEQQKSNSWIIRSALDYTFYPVHIISQYCFY